MRTFISTLLTLALLTACTADKTPTVTSPDGTVKLTLLTDDSLQLRYQVEVDGTPFLLPSRLGFEEKQGFNLSQSFKIDNIKKNQCDETWTQPWGENKTLRNHYNEMEVTLHNPDNVALTLRFRLFDDGLGFRYEYSVADADSLLVSDELTQFHFAQEATSWSIPANFDTY
ncbi:MAG: glycoside hydrolase family 97 N-terminal domain-containing protein, partial [Muribaculaceae bacterium]